MPSKGGDRSNQCWEGPGTYMGILGTYLQGHMNQGISLENGDPPHYGKVEIVLFSIPMPALLSL